MWQAHYVYEIPRLVEVGEIFKPVYAIRVGLPLRVNDAKMHEFCIFA